MYLHERLEDKERFMQRMEQLLEYYNNNNNLNFPLSYKKNSQPSDVSSMRVKQPPKYHYASH
jgi:hypothetical protein